MSGDLDAIIIGGGAAGLAAAERLISQKRRVRLLEGSDRLGGRVLTVFGADSTGAGELGAEFVHGLSPEMSALIARAGLTVKPLERSVWHAFSGMGLMAESLNEAFDSLIKELAALPCDLPLADYLDSLPPGRLPEGLSRRVLTYAEGLHVADPKRLSAKEFGRAQLMWEAAGRGDNYQITGGFGKLIEWLTRQIPAESVTMGAEVSLVAWEKGRVVVKAGKWELTARAVVVAVPLPSLRREAVLEGAIVFSPDLPEQRKGARQLEMGPVYKCVFQLKDSAPIEKGLETHGSSPPLPGSPAHLFHVAWVTEPGAPAWLTIWAGGPRAAALADKSPDEILHLALVALSDATGIEANELEELCQWKGLRDWQRDRFIGGGYSYPLVGAQGAHERLARSVDDTIFFAGEATQSDGSDGTVEGAIKSGWRAADQLMAAIPS